MSELSTSLKPYVGLIPFHEKDAQFFYGREKEREIITANLMASRLTLLYGESGVGKSSVLRAGVEHQLRRLARQNMARRGKPKHVIVVFNSWRDDPVTGLLESVRQSVTAVFNGQPLPAPVPRGLSLAESLRQWADRVQGHLLIILDQFEEYFLYHPNEEGDGTFAAEFPRAVNDASLPVNFIVSFRDDSFSRLDFFKGHIYGLYDRCYRVEHLDRDAAREAIVKPLEQYNLLQTSDKERVTIEPALVEEVLKQVRAGEKFIGDVGSGVVGDADGDQGDTWQIETPYLQMVMVRLWNEEVGKGSRVLRLETFNQLGGARRIVRTHLDSTMRALTKKERDIGASIFNHLITPSGTKIAQTIPDLAGYGNLPEAPLTSLMGKLSSGDLRILRVIQPPPNQPDYSRYEVFHDRLAEAILDWRRKYLNRKRMRRHLLVMAVLTALLLFMTALTVFAFQQRNKAEQQSRIAEQQSAIALQQADEARRQREAADLARQQVEIEKGNVEKARDTALKAEAAAKEAAAEAVAQRKTAEEERNKADQARQEADKQKKIAEEQRDAVIRAKIELDKNNLRLSAINKELADTQGKLEKQNERLNELTQEQQLLINKLEVSVNAEATAKELAQQEREKAQYALATVREIDRSNAYYKAVMRARGPIESASFSGDGTRVLTLNTEEPARVWDVNNDEAAIYELPQEVNRADLIYDASFNPQDKTVVAVASKMVDTQLSTITIWDLSGEKPVELDKREDKIITEEPDYLWFNSVTFSPSGNLLLIYGADGAKICKWDASTKKLEQDCLSLTPAGSPVYNAKFSPDERFVVTDSKLTQFWDVKTGRSIAALDSPTETSLSKRFAFSPDGRFIVMTRGNFASVFEASTGRSVFEVRHDPIVTGVAFNPAGTLLATAGSDNTARLWDLGAIREVARLQGHGAALTDIAFSPDGRFVVTASADRTARVWDVTAAGALFAELRGHINSVTSVAFSPDGKFVLTTGDKTARVWDVGVSQASSISQGTTTLKRDTLFDFDQGQSMQGTGQDQSNTAADVSYRITRKEGSQATINIILHPENKAQLALLDGAGTASQRSFERISVTVLEGLNYSSVPLGGTIDLLAGANNQLTKGQIFAVRTAEGNYAKVEVLKAGVEMQIRWVTYRANPSRQQQSPPARRDDAHGRGAEKRVGFNRSGKTFFDYFKEKLVRWNLEINPADLSWQSKAVRRSLTSVAPTALGLEEQANPFVRKSGLISTSTYRKPPD